MLQAKKAAIVALGQGHPKEEGAIREMERQGFVVHVVLENPNDPLEIATQIKELLGYYGEVVTVQESDLIH